MQPYSNTPYQTSAYLPPERNPIYKRQERRNLGRIGWALTIYYLTASLLATAAMATIKTFFPQAAELSYFNLLLQLIPPYVIGFPLFAGLLIGMPKQAPKKKKLGFNGWITFLAVAFFLMMAGNYIATGLMGLLETVKGGEITNAIDQTIHTFSPLENLILMVICAPIVEELMCRKLIIDRLMPYSEALAVTVSGVFFGLLHGNFYQFFYATFLGILFSYVYVKTGKILHTIIMHMIINFTGSIIAAFLTDMTSDLASAPTSINPWNIVATVYSMAMLALAVCGSILLYQQLKKLHLKKTGTRWLTLKTQFLLTLSSAGTIVFCVICLLTFFGSLYI